MKVTILIRTQIMTDAWRRQRATPKSAFSVCLLEAWAKERKTQAAVRKFMAAAKANGGVVCFGDLTRSPINRTLLGQPYARVLAYQAAYVTARFGR